MIKKQRKPCSDKNYSKKGGLLYKDVYYNRLVKASGVPKKYVKKVIEAIPEVVIDVVADCARVQIGEGIIIGGVMKPDDKRTLYSPLIGGYVEVKTFIRPTCEFGKTWKRRIIEAYNRKHPENQVKIEEKDENDDKDK